MLAIQPEGELITTNDRQCQRRSGTTHRINRAGLSELMMQEKKVHKTERFISRLYPTQTSQSAVAEVDKAAACSQRLPNRTVNWEGQTPML